MHVCECVCVIFSKRKLRKLLVVMIMMMWINDRYRPFLSSLTLPSLVIHINIIRKKKEKKTKKRKYVRKEERDGLSIDLYLTMCCRLLKDYMGPTGVYINTCIYAYVLDELKGRCVQS